MLSPQRSPFSSDFARSDADQLAGLLKALGDPARLRILGFLHDYGPLAVINLVPLIGLSQPTTSHHVRILTQAGLIRSRRDRKLILRELDEQAMAAMAKLLTPGGRR